MQKTKRISVGVASSYPLALLLLEACHAKTPHEAVKRNTTTTANQHKPGLSKCILKDNSAKTVTKIAKGNKKRNNATHTTEER